MKQRLLYVYLVQVCPAEGETHSYKLQTRL
jgi:hypothetical protein